MKFAKKPTWLVDAIGACIVLGVLAAAAWFGVVESADARTVYTDRRVLMATSRETLSAIALSRSEQERTLAEHERVVAALGGSQGKTSNEAYLETVAALSKDYGVRVFQYQPMGERTYPGLREQLYSFHVGGSTENLWQLLRAIEDLDAWADVSYLKLQGGDGDGDRLAVLTISMFFEDADGGASGSDGDSSD